MAIAGKSPIFFNIGDTSSNGWFSIVMLVFGGVYENIAGPGRFRCQMVPVPKCQFHIHPHPFLGLIGTPTGRRYAKKYENIYAGYGPIPADLLCGWGKWKTYPF